MRKVKILILPKFDIAGLKDMDKLDDSTKEGSLSYVGEATYSINEYFQEHETITLRNGKKLLYNPNTQIALGVSGAGIIGVTSYLSTLLADSDFDFSEGYILCVGCGGSAKGNSTMGDVCIASEVVNYDLGFDTVEVSDGKPIIKWYYNDIFSECGHKVLNRKLVERLYALTKDIPMNTTEITRRTMERNFPGEEWAMREPKVLLGTAFSGAAFWKGEAEHDKAVRMNEFYKCRDPYVITEMEDVACAVVAEQFGMLDRLVVLRASVNLDVFKDGETAEILWDNNVAYVDRVNNNNEETLDIFPVAMDNLFRVGKAVIEELIKN